MIGEDQILVARAVDVVAVDGNLDDVAGRFAFEFVGDGGGQNRIGAVDVADGIFDGDKGFAGFPVGHLVGQFDEFVFFNRIAHIETLPAA